MSEKDRQELFRLLPSVERVLQREALAALCERWNRELVAAAVSDEIDHLRTEIAEGMHSEESLAERTASLPDAVAVRVEAATASSFRRVINATGIVVHTNLGRSPLPASALERIAELGGRYLNLEYDLESGERGKRDSGVRRLLRLLFPGRDALVVNNNAAAVLLALNTLAEGREVAISRGQIIEIGDSFRINEIQGKSGARLVEVGTTNRTRIEDYAAAIGPQTALLLAVHPSNYRIVGFASQVPLAELVALGRVRGLPVVEDWGSGCLVEPGEYGIAGEESAAAVLANGPDAICFSGDKLLGGPQAGVVVGTTEMVERMRGNHLYRALRVGKLTLLALEEALRLYLAGRASELPALEKLGRGTEELRARAERIAADVGSALLKVVESMARVGGGAAPQAELPSVALAIGVEAADPEEIRTRLRENDPPVIARVQKDTVLLDMRTVFPDEDRLLVEALERCLSE